MNVIEVIRKRYSVRAYKHDPVEESKLQQVLEAAQLAPTASNRQPLRFIVIHTSGRETELRRIYNAAWFVEPPLIICGCAIASEAWMRMDRKNYCDVDLTIAMDHLILAATELGLGTCWIAAFDPAVARQVLRLPDSVEPVVFTPLGYANDRPGAKERKPLEEIVKYECW
jgi:nitroreductase